MFVLGNTAASKERSDMQASGVNPNDRFWHTFDDDSEMMYHAEMSNGY
jgi:hypothetical protein